MSRLGGGILAWLLAVATAVGADWRDHLPADWLLIAEAPELARLDDFVARLAAPWDRPAPPLRATLGALAPGDALADRAWAIAVAPDTTGAPTFVVYAPTDDFDALCEALDADRADDLALASLFGFDLVLEPLEGWARVSLIDAAPDFDDPPSAPVIESDARDALRVTLSEKGCRLLADQLEAVREGQVADRRRRYGPLRWPNDFKALVARVAPYAPVAAAIADWRAPLTLQAGLREERLSIELTAMTSLEVPRRERAAPSLALERSILWLEAPGPLPDELVAAWLAAEQSRPGRIEAPEYPQPQWDDFADACRDLAAGCRAFLGVLELPEPDEPAAANQRAALVWDSQTGPLGDRLGLCVDRWNTMLDASQARAPLKIELTAGEPSGGFRLRTDLIASAGLEPTPEIEAIFDRYYGAGRWMTTELSPRGGDDWVVTMRPGDLALAPERFLEVEPGTLLRGELRVDRLTAWRQRLDDLLKEGAIGRRVRPPMDETPTLRFQVTGGDRLRLTASAPLGVYEALVERYRSEPAPIDDD